MGENKVIAAFKRMYELVIDMLAHDYSRSFYLLFKVATIQGKFPRDAFVVGYTAMNIDCCN
jgi:hypothetical protein